MNPQSPSTQLYDFDFAPAMKMYAESFDLWKQNYEKFVQNAQLASNNSAASMATKPAEQAMSNWQAAGEVLFKRLVEQQVELCWFFGKRWALYLDYPERLARCKTPAEIAQLEMEFFKRMSTEYSAESAKLLQPMSDLMAAWAAGRPS